MNWDQIAGNSKQIIGKVKQKWGKLTGNDATAFAGKGDQLAGELQQKYGDSKQQAQNALGEFPPGLIPVTVPNSSSRCL
jgi:uncharacterized protein YjbJ (UPF0337 family)